MWNKKEHIICSYMGLMYIETLYIICSKGTSGGVMVSKLD